MSGGNCSSRSSFNRASAARAPSGTLTCGRIRRRPRVSAAADALKSEQVSSYPRRSSGFPENCLPIGDSRLESNNCLLVAGVWSFGLQVPVIAFRSSTLRTSMKFVRSRVSRIRGSNGLAGGNGRGWLRASLSLCFEPVSTYRPGPPNGRPGLPTTGAYRDGTTFPHGELPRQVPISRRRAPCVRSYAAMRNEPKTRACADETGWGMVLIAWFGACRFLVAPGIKEQ